MKRAFVSWSVGVVAAVTFAGCLFRTAEAPRFYRPASAALEADDEPAPPAATNAAAIRLQTVRSAPFLRERIVWRASPVEYGLYEQRRWFELPSRYVRRALLTALRSTPGLRLDDDIKSPRLDVELLAFDEVLSPTHEATVTLAVTLRDGTEKRLDHVFSAHVAIDGVEGPAMAQAMGQALDAAVKKVAEAAAKVLAKKPAPARARGTK